MRCKFKTTASIVLKVGYLVIILFTLLGCGVKRDEIDIGIKKIDSNKYSNDGYYMLDEEVNMNNLQNEGLIAGDESYLYFSTKNEGFCRLDIQSGNIEQISPEKAEGISVYNNGIVYNQNGYLYLWDNHSSRPILTGVQTHKMNYYLEGNNLYMGGPVCVERGEIFNNEGLTDVQEIAPFDLSSMAVYGEYIYGCDQDKKINGSINSNYGFWKINKDGSETVKLLDEPVNQFVIEEDNIYYIKDRQLCKMDINGENFSVYDGILMPSYSYSPTNDWQMSLQVFQNKIYFCAEDGFYKINTDGTDLTLLDEDNPYNIYIIAGSLYYDNHDGIFRMDLINNIANQVWTYVY